MAEVIIVSKTRMHNGLCISGIDMQSGRALRLLPQGANHQPTDSPLEIGQVWEIRYGLRNTPAPFVEDADATCIRFVRNQSVSQYVEAHGAIASGSTDAVYDGLLQWNPVKGYLEPNNPTSYSTQFWRPDSTLRRYQNDNKPGYVFWEPDTKRRIPWVGAAEPPATVPAASLARLSLGRPFSGNLDHEVCWLQLSGVF